MNIGERAEVIARTYGRQVVLDLAGIALRSVAEIPAAELVPGESVARIIAAALVRSKINGGEPRVVTRVLDDGCALSDQAG